MKAFIVLEVRGAAEVLPLPGSPAPPNAPFSLLDAYGAPRGSPPSVSQYPAPPGRTFLPGSPRTASVQACIPGTETLGHGDESVMRATPSQAQP